MLETERLILRPFAKGDEKDLYAYLKAPMVNCFADMKLHSLEEAEAEVAKRSSETEYCFAIVLKESGKVIGEMETYPETTAPGSGIKGARRIYAYTEDYNLPSQKLCEKLGMQREGLFLEFVSFVKNPDGTPCYENTMQYAILKKEWEKRSV